MAHNFRKAEVKARLKKARELLAEGWVQGASRVNHMDGTKSYCMLGAIDAACGVYETTSATEYVYVLAMATAVSEPIRKLLDSASSVRNIVMFNDNPTRTQEEVLEILDKAIQEIPDEDQT
jgi:hypothetical protein